MLGRLPHEDTRYRTEGQDGPAARPEGGLCPVSPARQPTGERPGATPQWQGSAALIEVMQAWEELTDEQRLSWNVEAKTRRRHGVNYFKQVNLRRLRRGEELATTPPRPQPHSAKPLLKQLHLRNRRGRVTLELELHRAPTTPTTVWGSRPCNRGAAKPRNCPRLGWLPESKGRRIEITGPYFQKHAQYLDAHRLPLVGKRIFIRTREERDDGVNLYEEVHAVVPGPEP